MPLRYLEQEILAKEKLWSRKFKGEKNWDKRNAIKLTKLIVYKYFFQKCPVDRCLVRLEFFIKNNVFMKL